MAKNVFTAAEVYNMTSKVFIPPPKFEKPKVEVAEYTGPTIEDIEEQNKKLIMQTEEEAKTIVEEARIEAGRVVQEAEGKAFEYVKKATLDANKIEEEVKIRTEEFKIAKENEIQKKVAEQKELLRKEYQETKEAAHREGYEAGYAEGKIEADRLIKRMHTIIEEAIDRRDTIIQDAEDQVIRIILLIARKVVKSISEEQKKVVIDNIKAALQKIKGKTEVIVRVNTEDLELSTEHKEEVMQQFEELKQITILEDTRIDKGGCIIETDFGSVDARIATQLAEIEEKIRELANISYFEVPKVVKLKEAEKEM